jgi:3-dehydroquinate synthase
VARRADNERSFDIRVPGREPSEYEVRVERGAFADVANLCLSAVSAHRYAIISDSRVGPLYGERAMAAFGGAGAEAGLFTFPAGEWNKTPQEWANLSAALTVAGYGRDSAIVAVGGGVTGDLAGFVAATYMRGVPHVQVPTSLLAMLDSSIGGKTGIGTQEAKNPIGAFHHPRLVLIDPELLTTLPAFQLSSGLAEAVKAAAISDGELFGWLEVHAEQLLDGEVDLLCQLIRGSVRIKARIVEEDPEESGKREILNFGHTIGHALEAMGGYAVLHGEAVAAGMRTEARLGELCGVTEPGTTARLAALLEACGLDRPVEDDFSAVQLLKATRADKKSRRGVPRFIFLRRIGEVARPSSAAYTHELPLGSAERLLQSALRSSDSEID